MKIKNVIIVSINCVDNEIHLHAYFIISDSVTAPFYPISIQSMILFYYLRMSVCL